MREQRGIIIYKFWSFLIFILSVFGPGLQARPVQKAVFPLKVSTDKRHLVDQNEQPFLIIGDTAWSLMVVLTKEQAESYLEDRRLKGFNTILVNLIEHYFGGPANAYGEQPFLKRGDFATPNEKYFSHADWIIGRAAEKGLLVILAPAYLGFGCGEQGWCQELSANGPVKCQTYGQYLANRYWEYPNIIWLAGGDAEAGNVRTAHEALIAGIKAIDTAHLVTAHCFRQKSALDCYDEPWLDLNSTYSDCAKSAFRSYNDYYRQRLMPFFYVEGTYENEGADEICLRSQAYWAILAGASGHIFGNNPIWFFGPGWQKQLDSPGARSMMILSDLYQSRPWSQLIPDFDHTVVISGYGDVKGSRYVASARSLDGNLVLAYLPYPTAIGVDLKKINGSQAKAWWFNPARGSAKLIGILPTQDTKTFQPDSSGDWVLVLDNAALDLAAPGAPNPEVPVNLVNFEAWFINNQVHLKWQTLSEQNNFGFEVECSKDSQNFEKIGFVPGAGSASGPNFYEFIDSNIVSGQRYYRLKQRNTDGTFDLVANTQIRVVLPVAYELRQNYPNPFNAMTLISYSLPQAAKVELRVYDAQGKLMTRLVDRHQLAGRYEVVFSGIPYPSGIYFYQIKIENFVAIKKMVLLR